MKKRQTLEKGSALFKNDITGSELTVKILDTLQIHAIQYHDIDVGDITGFRSDYITTISCAAI